MKKITILLVAFLFCTLSFSQKIKIEKGHYDSYDGISTDVATGTTVATFKIFVNKDYTYFYDIIADLDSAGDGTNFTVELEGSMNDINYYDISSDIWGVTTTDTIYRFSNYTSTQTIASYTITDVLTDTVGTTTSGTVIQIWDTASANGDTATSTYALTGTEYNAGTNTHTVAAQTVTVSEPKVGWRWLQIKLTGAGAGAAMILDRIDVSILRE